jgi:Tryptophanyl-tRNA synthetase
VKQPGYSQVWTVEKMSKSYNNTIPIFFDEKKLKKSIMKIKTNSLEPGEPKDSSTCTIFSLYKAISSESDLNELQSQYDNGIAWGEAKTILFDRLNEFLKPYKNEYDRIIEDRGYVEQVLLDGANTAKEVSTPLIEQIRSAVGIRGF